MLDATQRAVMITCRFSAVFHWFSSFLADNMLNFKQRFVIQFGSVFGEHVLVL